MEMKEFSEHNDDYNYLLCVIGCYSKYAWCEKLKTKAGQETARAFEQIFNKGRTPNFSLIWVKNSITKKLKAF